MFVANEDRVAPESPQPFHDILRVADAATQQEQLRLRGREREREFVIQTAIRVREHLILVYNQENGAITLNQAVLLSFEGGDDDRRAEIFREVAGGNAYIPTARAPFRELVV